MSSLQDETDAFFDCYPQYRDRVLSLARKLDKLVKESGLSHIECPCCGSTASLTYLGDEGEFHIGLFLTPEKDIAGLKALARGHH
jgi:hypothetical protein